MRINADNNNQGYGTIIPPWPKWLRRLDERYVKWCSQRSIDRFRAKILNRVLEDEAYQDVRQRRQAKRITRRLP